jgi:hypothetical protein
LLLAMLLVAGGVAAFSALESHVVSVQAHVDPPLWQEVVGCEAIAPDGSWQPCPDPLAVPKGLPVRWHFLLHIRNPLDVAVTGVQVTEEFAPQVWVFMNGPNKGTVSFSYPGDPPHPLLAWNDLTLQPGDSFKLDFEVETLDGEFADAIPDLVLAAGAVMTGTITGGSDLAATTASIHIEVLDPPDGLEINTDIDFGTVFPQETRTDYFKVCLSKTYCQCGGCGGGCGSGYGSGCGSGCGTGCGSGCGCQATTDYKIVLKLKPLECGGGCSHSTQYYPDLRPYLIVQRDPAETHEPAEPDGIANGIAGDYTAQGHLDATTDQCDKWLVTMRVPVFADEYNPETDPIPPDQVLVLPPEANPNGWDLGADVKVELGGSSWSQWVWDWWGGSHHR